MIGGMLTLTLNVMFGLNLAITLVALVAIMVLLGSSESACPFIRSSVPAAMSGS